MLSWPGRRVIDRTEQTAQRPDLTDMDMVVIHRPQVRISARLAWILVEPPAAGDGSCQIIRRRGVQVPHRRIPESFRTTIFLAHRG